MNNENMQPGEATNKRGLKINFHIVIIVATSCSAPLSDPFTWCIHIVPYISISILFLRVYFINFYLHYKKKWVIFIIVSKSMQQLLNIISYLCSFYWINHYFIIFYFKIKLNSVYIVVLTQFFNIIFTYINI